MAAMAEASWKDADAARLFQARLSAGHSQQRCADELRCRGCAATQDAVSEWERGSRTPQLKNRAVLKAYVAEHLLQPDDVDTGAGAERRIEPDAAGDSQGEWPLSSLQRALVEAGINRLQSASGALSDTEWRLWADLRKVLWPTDGETAFDDARR